MMRTPFFLVVAGFFSSCVSISEAECRSGAWYDLGYRDALLYGIRPQIEIYARQCGALGVSSSESDYLDGWKLGYSEWNRRGGGGDDD
jgi:hypothetical protein